MCRARGPALTVPSSVFSVAIRPQSCPAPLLPAPAALWHLGRLPPRPRYIMCPRHSGASSRSACSLVPRPLSTQQRLILQKNCKTPLLPHSSAYNPGVAVGRGDERHRVQPAWAQCSPELGDLGHDCVASLAGALPAGGGDSARRLGSFEDYVS